MTAVTIFAPSVPWGTPVGIYLVAAFVIGFVLVLLPGSIRRDRRVVAVTPLLFSLLALVVKSNALIDCRAYCYFPPIECWSYCFGF